MKRRHVLVGALAAPLLAAATSCQSLEPKGSDEAPEEESAAPASGSGVEAGKATVSVPDQTAEWSGLVLARFGESVGEPTTVRVVDASDGSTAHHATFPLSKTDGSAYIPGGWDGQPWGWTQERYAFSPALDRLAVVTAGNEGGNKVGWIEPDGVFTDVSSLVIGDPSAPDNSFATDVRPVFDPSGGFWAARLLPSSHLLVHLPPGAGQLELVHTEQMNEDPMGIWIPVVEPDGSIAAFNVESGGVGWLSNVSDGRGCPLLYTADTSSDGMCLSTDDSQSSLTILPAQPSLSDFPSFSDGWTPSDYVAPVLDGNSVSGMVTSAVFDPTGEQIAFLLDGSLDPLISDGESQSEKDLRLYSVRVSGGSVSAMPKILVEEGEILVGWS